MSDGRSALVAPRAGSIPDVSIVLPSYRDAQRSLKSVRELRHYLGGLGLAWEIVVVDDGGGDFDDAAEWSAESVQLIRFPRNRGKGAAVRAGMLAARGRCRIATDADLPFELSVIPVTIEYVVNRRYHLVVGDRTLAASRYAIDIGWKRRMASFVFSQFAGKLVTGGFFDTQCGFKGFRDDVAQLLFSNAIIDRFAFDVEVIYLALKYRLDIKRVPVVLRNNQSSSVRLARDSARMLVDVFRIKAHQMSGRYDNDALRELLSRDIEFDMASIDRAPEIEDGASRRLRTAQVNGPRSR